MEKKYIAENRYKKTSRTVNRKRNIVKKTKTVNKKIGKKKKSNNKRNSKDFGKFVRFIFCSILLLLIIIITRAVTIKDDEPFIPTFFNKEVTENTESINIAVYDNVDINSSNAVVTELEQYIYPMLLRITDKYSINYEVISSINRLSNKEYELSINTEGNISAVDVKDTIDKIIASKNKYYSKVENVDKIEIKSSNKLLVSLKKEDEYFIYNLNIPIYKNDSQYGIYSIDGSSNKSKLVLARKHNASKEYIKYINVIKVNNEEEAIEKYKQGVIDVFFASSNNAFKMLGKYEYDIKSYNSGEGIFLIFNPNSNLSSQKYIRQIVAYSINREGILSDVGNSSAKIVDLPYIYDEEKYKYDVYAAENTILSNGYKKQGLYYVKGKTKLSLDLIVNKDDEEKISIANKIKNDLLKVGVNLNINKLSENEINRIIGTAKYDMLLASVYINENPNINHILSHVSMSNEARNQIDNIKASEIESITDNILKLKTILSDEISIYGIYSKQTYIIYKKGINLFQNINYMGLFNSYFD